MKLTLPLILLLVAGEAWAYTPAPTRRPTPIPSPTPVPVATAIPTPVPTQIPPTVTPTYFYPPTVTNTPFVPAPTPVPPAPIATTVVGAISAPWTVTVTVRNYPTSAKLRITTSAVTGNYMIVIPIGKESPWVANLMITGFPKGSTALLEVLDSSDKVVSTSSTLLP